MGMHCPAVNHSWVLHAVGMRPKHTMGCVKAIRGLLAYSLRLAQISRKLMQRKSIYDVKRRFLAEPSFLRCF